MIDISALSKSYGRRAVLRGVSFTVSEGESVALWGGNGAGKTTILRCILGLVPYTGRIEVGGIDAGRRGPEARSLIGYLPQELPAHGAWRALEAMHFVARLRGAGLAQCAPLLERVGLEREGRTRIEEFSGGMKQRLALAMALIENPPVLLLDEATAGLDLAGRRDLLRLLEEVRGEGRTLLFTTHRPDEVDELASRVIVLDQGRLALDGEPSRLAALLDAGAQQEVA